MNNNMLNTIHASNKLRLIRGITTQALISLEQNSAFDKNITFSVKQTYSTFLQ